MSLKTYLFFPKDVIKLHLSYLDCIIECDLYLSASLKELEELKKGNKSQHVKQINDLNVARQELTRWYYFFFGIYHAA